MGCPIFKGSYSEAIEDSSSAKKKMILLGLDGSGKSSILEFLKTSTHTNISSTVGVNIETLVIDTNEYLMFDIAGKVRSLWSHYYENVDAFIFVIDVNDKTRFGLIREELRKINENDGLKDKVMLVYLNKQDINDGTLQDQDILHLNGVNEVTEIDTIVQKCSVTKGQGVKEGFMKLLKIMKTIEQSKSLKQSNDSEILIKSKIVN
jgi:ADP-ribosylation factor 1/2